MLETGERVQHPQSLMSQEFIDKMAKDLIRMCDVIEKHGLIDYQYGVAEEQIIQGMSVYSASFCSGFYANLGLQF
jgi:hypothetical protein